MRIALLIPILTLAVVLTACGGGDDPTPAVDNSNLDNYVGIWHPTSISGCGQSIVQVLDSNGQPTGYADQSYAINLEKIPGSKDSLHATLNTEFYAPTALFATCLGKSLGTQSLSNVTMTISTDTKPVTNLMGIVEYDMTRVHITSPGFQGPSSQADIKGLRYPAEYFTNSLDLDIGVNTQTSGVLKVRKWVTNYPYSFNLMK